MNQREVASTPGVTGNEPEIAGNPNEDLCEKCVLVDDKGDCDPNRPDCPITVRDESKEVPFVIGDR